MFNLFNQHAPITLYNSPLAGGYTTPTAAPGSPGAALGWDYLSLMNNFDYLGLMNDKSRVFVPPTATAAGFWQYAGPNTNGKPNTLASRYGQPVFYQGARSLRLQIKFTF